MLIRASVLALLLGAFGPSILPAQQETIVYSGVPEVRMGGDGMEATRDLMASDRRNEYRLRIVKRDGRYYWASRGDRELRRSTSGRYIIFSCDAGIVKIVDPMFDRVRAPLRTGDPSEHFDYVEIMHQHLSTLTYWGRGTGDSRLLNEE